MFGGFHPACWAVSPAGGGICPLAIPLAAQQVRPSPEPRILGPRTGHKYPAFAKDLGAGQMNRR
jgi:hypothetical protein